jgi:hypothetical protein
LKDGIFAVPISLENGLQLAPQRGRIFASIVDCVLCDHSNSSGVCEIITGPVARADVSNLISDHVLVVIDTTEWNFLLILRCWHNEAFLWRKMRHEIGVEMEMITPTHHLNIDTLI